MLLFLQEHFRWLCSVQHGEQWLEASRDTKRQTLSYEDTSSPEDFKNVEEEALEEYDKHLAEYFKRKHQPRVDWMGNVLPPML